MTFNLHAMGTDAPPTYSPTIPRRTILAHELGFTEYPKTNSADPYLNYIENRLFEDGSLAEYLDLFTKVVKHFQDSARAQGTAPTPQQPPVLDPNSIHAYIDVLCASSTEPLFAKSAEGSVERKELVTDTVLYILGVWVSMLSYFVTLPGGYRQIQLAYCLKQGRSAANSVDVALVETLPDLLKKTGLLPSSADGKDLVQSNGSDLDRIIQTMLPLIPANPAAAPNNAHSVANQNLRTALSTYISSTTSSASIQASSQTSTLAPLPSYQFDSSPSASLLHSGTDSLESLSIKRSKLNAYLLSSLGGLSISWTQNISRHLLLSKFAGKYALEVFALPCILQGSGSNSLKAAGIPISLMSEIQESYSILFNPAGTPSFHAEYGMVIGLKWWCWCRSCSVMRLRKREVKVLKHKLSAPAPRNGANVKSEFDPLLEQLMENCDPSDWSYELFPHLWTRIVALEEHLVNAKPWSFWVLFRDRRNTLQFWTFL